MFLTPKKPTVSASKLLGEDCTRIAVGDFQKSTRAKDTSSIQKFVNHVNQVWKDSSPWIYRQIISDQLLKKSTYYQNHQLKMMKMAMLQHINAESNFYKINQPKYEQFQIILSDLIERSKVSVTTMLKESKHMKAIMNPNSPAENKLSSAFFLKVQNQLNLSLQDRDFGASADVGSHKREVYRSDSKPPNYLPYNGSNPQSNVTPLVDIDMNVIGKYGLMSNSMLDQTRDMTQRGISDVINYNPLHTFGKSINSGDDYFGLSTSPSPSGGSHATKNPSFSTPTGRPAIASFEDDEENEEDDTLVNGNFQRPDNSEEGTAEPSDANVDYADNVDESYTADSSAADASNNGGGLERGGLGVEESFQDINTEPGPEVGNSFRRNPQTLQAINEASKSINASLGPLNNIQAIATQLGLSTTSIDEQIQQTSNLAQQLQEVRDRMQNRLGSTNQNLLAQREAIQVEISERDKDRRLMLELARETNDARRAGANGGANGGIPSDGGISMMKFYTMVHDNMLSDFQAITEMMKASRKCPNGCLLSENCSCESTKNRLKRKNEEEAKNLINQLKNKKK